MSADDKPETQSRSTTSSIFSFLLSCLVTEMAGVLSGVLFLLYSFLFPPRQRSSFRGSPDFSYLDLLFHHLSSMSEWACASVSVQFIIVLLPLSPAVACRPFLSISSSTQFHHRPALPPLQVIMTPSFHKPFPFLHLAWVLCSIIPTPVQSQSNIVGNLSRTPSNP